MYTDINEQFLTNKEINNSPYFSIESFMGDFDTWQKIKPEVSEVFETVTRDIIPDKYKQKELENLEWDFCQNTTHIVLLRNKDTNKLVGFTLAKPFKFTLDLIPLHDKEQAELNMDKHTYTDLHKNHTIEVGWTLILEDFRHRGGWSKMMDALDTSIKADPQIHFMVRDVREKDNYAQAVRKRYESKIVYEDTINSVLGPQIYFRIKL